MLHVAVPPPPLLHMHDSVSPGVQVIVGQLVDVHAHEAPEHAPLRDSLAVPVSQALLVSHQPQPFRAVQPEQVPLLAHGSAAQLPQLP